MLTPEQVEQYRQSGYLVVEQVLGDAEAGRGAASGG